MKLTSFLLLAFVISVSASVGYSQSTKLKLRIENGTFRDVLKQIENQSEFYFYYNNDEISKLKDVSIDVDGMKIEDVLNKLLTGTNLEYQIIDRYIALKTKGGASSNDIQQQKSVSGKVTDTSGGALPGVSVVVKGTSNGTITDTEGNYSISNVSAEATLQFSFVGMKSEEIAVGNKLVLNVVLTEESVGIEEIVAVGYGTQKRETITGSIATVKSDRLTVAPIASLSNSLGGQLPGLVSVQQSGQPGFDAATLSIRGFAGALVIVDGVESSFNNIDANEIESVSILKDGASSIYGARAGNGVILITTKRGINEKPTITLNSSFTMQGITAMPKPSSAGQYAEMQSEAWLQSGRSPDLVPYTKDQIKKYYDGGDPLYPNTDWYNVLIRDWAPQQQHNLSVRGGSDRIKYYGFVGWMDQKTVWKNNGGEYSRYNIQSNIDAKIFDNLSLQLDLATIIENREFPWRPMTQGQNTVWQDFWNTLPIYPSTLPDPTKIPHTGGQGNFMTNRELAGYNDNLSQNLRGTISLNYTFNSIKGLSAKAFVNGLQNFSGSKNFTKAGSFYTYDPASEIYTLAASLGSKAALGQSKNQDRTITGQLSLNFDRDFGQDHHINALVLYEVIDFKSDFITAFRQNFISPAIDQLFAGSTAGWTNGGSANEWGRASYVGRINYSFKNKYLMETILRADASAKFPSDKRWGYFPSVSLGWRMTEENFMKSLGTIDNLKLRASYGQSGNDHVGNFQYLSGYQYGHLAILDNSIQQGIVSTGLANPFLTWEKITIYNGGLDFSLLNRKIYGEGDIFYRLRDGIPATKINTLPSTFGSGLPPENINSLNDRGFELKLGTSGKILGNELLWDLVGNISWSRSKWDHFEEPEYTDPDQERIYKMSGRWTDRQYGYVSEGLFTSQTQIDALPYDMDSQGNSSLRPGDIKYKDVNNDAQLDWKDQVEIGKGTVPHWMAGVNYNMSYKNFDLSVLFSGAFGYYNYIVLTHGALPPAVAYDMRWTEANNDANAFVPRLGGATTNSLTSDFYYKKAGYMRLKNASIGYSLPKRLVEKINFQTIRIYIAGTNLLTFDKLNKYKIDPESPTGNAGYYYPQQRTISLGANIAF